MWQRNLLWYYGTLSINTNKQYILQGDGVPENHWYVFTTGDPIQIWLGGHWINGRIEYDENQENYYFLSSEGDLAGLVPGMSVRISPNLIGHGQTSSSDT